MTDGLLDITWLNSADEPSDKLLSLAELMMAGWVKEDRSEAHKKAAMTEQTLQTRSSKVNHAHAKKVRISCQPKCKYVIDGELFEPDDLNIEVQPASLKVFIPYQDPLTETE